MAFVDQIRAQHAPFRFSFAIDVAAAAIRPELRHSACRRAEGGVTVLESEDRLNDYLVAYGEMHMAKLLSFLPSVPLDGIHELVIVDWGCGQGLASAVTLEYLRDSRPELSVVAIRLLEVSNAARARAAEIVRRYENAFDVRAYPWDLANVAETVEALPSGITVLHLFSNILDVVSKDISEIASIIRFQSKRADVHVLCVGPKRCSTDSIGLFYGCFDGAIIRRVSDHCVSVKGKYYPYVSCSCYGICFSVLPLSAKPLPVAQYYTEDLFAFAAANMADALAEAIRSGLDVDAVDVDGSTAVLLAAKFGAVEALSVLVAAQADVRRCNAKGASPLYFAAKYGETKCLSILLAAGAEIERRIPTSGLTPYLVAAKYGRVDCMRVLAESGCDISACDSRGRDARLLAKRFSEEVRNGR